MTLGPFLRCIIPIIFLSAIVKYATDISKGTTIARIFNMIQIINIIIFNLSSIVIAQRNVWFIVPLLPMFILFCVSMLAETNRHPFDLPEAEAELVSGYNVEYSAMTFALFFLGEYANMLLMSAFVSILFLGG